MSLSKKLALLAVFALGFIMVGSELRRYYEAYVPPLKEGECARLRDQGMAEVIIKVKKNDWATSSSFMDVEVKSPFASGSVSMSDTFTSIRREIDHKIDCKEIGQ